MKERLVMDIDENNLPQHIAIIMDGNRRWAKEKGLDYRLGHKAGAENLERTAKFLNKLGVKYMTVYAFSTENWKRSEEEVGALMTLLKNYLEQFSNTANTENIKLNLLGDISKVPLNIANGIKNAIEKTKNNTGLTLNIAFNYGGRMEIVNAVKNISKQIKENKLEIDDISEETISNSLYTVGQPDPDLVIRTSGELRTSNFLPWQIVYSEFYFPEIYWPDFKEDEIKKAIIEYQKRNRKFGGK